MPLGANTVPPPSCSDDPHMGAIVSKFKHRTQSVPGYVAISELTVRMSPVPVAGGGRQGTSARAILFHSTTIPRGPSPRWPVRPV